MSALRDAADDLARRPPPPVLSSERMFATERAAARLESRRIATRTAAAPDPADVEVLDAHALRRLLDTIWTEPRWAGAAARVVERASTIGTPSLDRALLRALARQDPAGHPAYAALQVAATIARSRL